MYFSQSNYMIIKKNILITRPKDNEFPSNQKSYGLELCQTYDIFIGQLFWMYFPFCGAASEWSYNVMLCRVC